MKDSDIDTHLRQHLTGDKPREVFKQQTLHDSTVEFVRVYQRRSGLRRAELAAAAILIASLAFLGGRLSTPSALPESMDVAHEATTEPEGVTVSSDLVAWLDAARLFNQLGMQDRMARAVERAGRLLPADTFIPNDQTLRASPAGSIGSQTECVEPMGIQGPHPLVENINQILAQSLGD